MSKTTIRPSGRTPEALRPVRFELGYAKHAEGSCLICMGDTHVLCTASLEDRLPPWLRGRGSGWLTAEYGMLPRATHSRARREASAGKQSGRTQEIQRLIGRALRAVIDLKALGEYQISIDCDVLQADGGTRTASITGGYLALHQCIEAMVARGLVKEKAKENLLREPVAAISCGIYKGVAVADLDYDEDANADADANFVMTASGNLIEVQATAEGAPFSQDEFSALLNLARDGIDALVVAQKDALASVSSHVSS